MSCSFPLVEHVEVHWPFAASQCFMLWCSGGSSSLSYQAWSGLSLPVTTASSLDAVPTTFLPAEVMSFFVFAVLIDLALDVKTSLPFGAIISLVSLVLPLEALNSL